MAFDFSDYLVIDSTDSSPGCNSDFSLEDAVSSGERLLGGEDKGTKLKESVLNDIDVTDGHEPFLHLVGASKDEDEVFEEPSEQRRNTVFNRNCLQNGYTKPPPPQRKAGSDVVNQDGKACSEKLRCLSSNQVCVYASAAVKTSNSSEDLDRSLEKKVEVKESIEGCSELEASFPLNSRHREGHEGHEGPDSQRPELRQPPTYRNRRSLPDWLTGDHVMPAKQEARKNYSSRRGSVKFADEFGLNLNTFMVIPPRYIAQAWDDVTRSDVMMTTGGLRMTQHDIYWNFVRDLRHPFSDEDNDGSFWSDRTSAEILSIQKSRQEGNSTEKTLRRHGSFSERRTLPSSPQGTNEEDSTEGDSAASDGRSIHKFHLCFEQPFADLESFQRKLKTNFLCLENVRVDDRSPMNGEKELGQSGRGFSKASQTTTILCSIKVCRTGGPKNVFARCTDNDWVTYADLPTQKLSGVASLGFDFDTFCFAVRKPVREFPEDDGRERKSGRATLAVEFALCCCCPTTDGGERRYWDNNDNNNYRIEWFD